MDEEQSSAAGPGGPEPDHVPGTGKGEEMAVKEGREPGREDLGTSHADQIIARSRNERSRPREVVEEKLTRFLDHPEQRIL